MSKSQVSSRDQRLSLLDWRSLVTRRLITLSPLGALSAPLARASRVAGYTTILDLGERARGGWALELSALEQSLQSRMSVGVRIATRRDHTAWRATQLCAWVKRGLITRVIVDESADWGEWSVLADDAPRAYQLWVEARTEEGGQRDRKSEV